MSPPTAPASPYLSVVIPFYNEEENVESVAREVIAVLEPDFARRWELVLVNDGSKDRTGMLMDGLRRAHPSIVRSVHVRPNSGQSAALEAGFRAARGEFIGTLDGDGQNDPRDLPGLLRERESRNVDMMCGIRTRRADTFLRKLSSRLANSIRSAVLKDGITDVGCSMRVFRRSCARRVRFFRNAHRFFPALFAMQGYTIAETPVNHRARSAGTSKYGFGINTRLWVGIADLMGVWWLRRRALRYRIREDQ